MTVFHVDANSTKYHVPDRLVCKIVVDPELIVLCEQGGIHKGTPIGQMSELWPLDRLKAAILEQAETFVSHMRVQGNVLQGSIYAMELWGPYRDKPISSDVVNIEAGNSLVPEGRWAGAARGAWQPETLGPRLITQDLLDRDDFRHGVCYRVRGLFDKTIGHQEESTGTVIL